LHVTPNHALSQGSGVEEPDVDQPAELVHEPPRVAVYRSISAVF
jgi:hypothetical protein